MSDLATLCEADSDWGPCQQPVQDPTMHCAYHWHKLSNPSAKTDRYYEQKIVRGLVQPTDNYLSATEIQAMFKSVPKGDGRRLDAYTV